MSSTNFTNGVTLTDDDWFNDLNRLHYTIFADPTNLASAQAAFFSAQVGANVALGGTLSVSAAAEFRVLACSDLSASAVAGLVVATQAQMETGTSVATLVSPGRQQFHPSAAKAWCSFNGAAASVTAAAAYNIASITDNGTGDYTFNFTVSFSSANFCGLCLPGTSPSEARLASTGAANAEIQIFSSGGVATDGGAKTSVAFFGDQ